MEKQTPSQYQWVTTGFFGKTKNSPVDSKRKRATPVNHSAPTPTLTAQLPVLGPQIVEQVVVANQVPGTTTLDLRDRLPWGRVALRAGMGGLDPWVESRPAGVFWSNGWWTDFAVLGLKDKPAPSGHMQLRDVWPHTIADEWTSLLGQVVEHPSTRVSIAWVLAMAGDVPLAVFTVAPEGLADLLERLGASTPESLANEWALHRSSLLAHS